MVFLSKQNKDVLQRTSSKALACILVPLIEKINASFGKTFLIEKRALVPRIVNFSTFDLIATKPWRLMGIGIQEDVIV